ncbi:hypothetical protein [Thermococcus piezophilus]|uniref:hypothetical protein n=1 Tax=Thermococcus piezophilus TaxID=1712654 RepID=UPI0019026F6F|nr:hypothetical protein [Thermococcus piezophilus]
MYSTKALLFDPRSETMLTISPLERALPKEYAAKVPERKNTARSPQWKVSKKAFS